MAAAVDEPLLIDHRAGLIPGHSAGVRTCPMPGLRAFDALAGPFCPDCACSVRMMHDLIRVAMEYDCANEWAVVTSGARFS